MFWKRNTKKAQAAPSDAHVPAEERVEFQLEVVHGDITTQDVDVVVNAANRALLGGGGVDGAIHAAAGPSLLAECQEVRRTQHPDGLPIGAAVATGAGDLPARWVVHTVGPNFKKGQRDSEDLAACYESSLKVADELGATSVAFPAVSAGIYGWPLEDAARIAVRTVQEVGPSLRSVRTVRFVLFTEDITNAFERAVDESKGAA